MLISIQNHVTVSCMYSHRLATHIRTKATVPKGTVLRLSHVCHIHEKYNQNSSQYEKNLIAQEHNPVLVKEQFGEVRKITRTQARTSEQKPNLV